MVEHLRPATLSEALENRARTHALPFAGGTDLMVQYRGYTGTRTRIEGPVLFLDAVEELRRIEAGPGGEAAGPTGGTSAGPPAAGPRGEPAGPAPAGAPPPVGAGELTIGAGVTYSEMLAVEELPTLLRQAVERIAAPGLRNRATMAGNLCNASPAADCLPPLYVHEATVRVSSVRGERVIPIAEFPTGPRTTVLEADEIVSAVTIPHLPAGRLYYRKVGTRKANALSKLSAAGYARMSGERIEEFRFAVGAVAPTVVRLSHAEELLRGARRGEVSLEAVLEAAEGAMKPIDDQRSTATYRREVALNALREFLSELLESDTSEET